MTTFKHSRRGLAAFLLLTGFGLSGGAVADQFNTQPTRLIGPTNNVTVGASINGQGGWTVTQNQFDEEISTARAHAGRQAWHVSNWYHQGTVNAVLTPAFPSVKEGAPGSRNHIDIEYWFNVPSNNAGLLVSSSLTDAPGQRMTYAAVRDDAGVLTVQTVGISQGIGWVNTDPPPFDDPGIHYAIQSSGVLAHDTWYRLHVAVDLNVGAQNDQAIYTVYAADGTTAWTSGPMPTWEDAYLNGQFGAPNGTVVTADHIGFRIVENPDHLATRAPFGYATNRPVGMFIDDVSATPNVGTGIATGFENDRYVSTNGTDSGDCSVATPDTARCKTIAYALTKAGSDNTIHVASGVYDLQSGAPLTIATPGVQLIGEGVTQPQIKRSSGPIDQPLLIVNAATNARVSNFEFDMDQSYVAEGIIASGVVTGLSIDHNHFVSSRSNAGQNSQYKWRNAIAINYNNNSQSPPLPRVDGSTVSIANNIIDGVVDLNVFLRAGIQMDAGNGSISGNTITAGVHDIVVRFATTNGSSTGTSVDIDGNHTFGRGVEFDAPNSGVAATISNNDIHALAGIDGFANNYGADWSILRLMDNASNVSVGINGNTFSGYQGSYRGVLVDNFPNATFTGNTFNPASGVSDFASLVISNKGLNTDVPPDSPHALSITANGNTFNGSGIANAGRAVEFLNDNDAGGTATFGSLMFGAVTPNTFDGNLRWYFHLDDYNCETTSGSPLCVSPPLPNYNDAIGNSATVNTDVRPFASNVSAANNSFAGVNPSGGTTLQQQGAILAHTYDSTANLALGTVDYNFAAFTTVYVDASYSGGYGDAVSFTSPAADCGAGATQSGFIGINAFATITQALAHVPANGYVCVAPGTYAETDGAGSNLVISQAVHLIGAQQGIDARSRGDAGASILIPAVADPSLSYAGPGAGYQAIVTIASDNVTLDGFVLDGDNPGLTSGIAMGAADPDVDDGIAATGSHIDISHNVIRNLVYAGIDNAEYPASVPAGQGNVISYNWIHNIDAPSQWGLGIVVLWNYYANVHHNLMDDVRIGIQTNYYFKTAPVPADAVIANNEIHASAIGIYHNYFTSDTSPSSPFTLQDNQIFANVNSAQTGLWVGIIVQGLYADSTAIIKNNQIDGSALAGSGRVRAGYRANLITTTQASTTSIDGGTVSHVDYGLLVTDGAFYAGNVDDLLVQNLAFSDVSLAAFYVEDTALAGTETTDFAPKVTIGSGMSYSNVAQQGALAGPQATIAYASGAPMLSSILVRAANGGHRAGQADSNGNVRSVNNALINSGIADVATGGTVTVEAGTFTENVVVNKTVTLKGAFAGTPGNAVARGSNESVLTQATRGTGVPLTISAANVTVDGMAISHVTGAEMALLSSGAAPTRDGIKLLNNRLDDYIADRSSSVGFQIGTSSNLEIAGNWVGNFSNGPTSGKYAMGIRLDSSENAHVHDNTFWNVQSVNVQVNQSTGAVIENNAIDATAAPGTGNAGVQVANNNNVTVRGNTIAHVDSGLLVTPNNTTTVSLYCNTVTDSTRGLYALGAPWSGTHTIGAIFDNRIEATTLIQTNWSAGELTVGSNYYGGATPINALVNIADPLSSSPIGQSACGNNTPTQIVAYAGSPQTTPISTAFTNPLVARVQDALGGAVMATQSVTFTPPGSGASASLGAATGSTDFNGTFSTTATANGLAGSYTVTAASGALTTSPGGFALTNAKGTGTVVWDITSFVYSGSNVTPTAHIAEESGATCVFTPASVGPNVGSYPVSASCDSANYTATGSTNVSITPANATLSLSHLVQAYDGAPKSVLVTTAPVGVGYSVSYVGTGSTTYGPSNYPPVAVGTYTATASVNDPNYVGSNVSASLQIVTSNGDISLVVNGPIDPIHVGDYAQFAATMLANPALHTGDTFAYEVVLSKSGGDPLAISDVASMEVFYNGSWVDVTTLTGGPLPFTPGPNNTLVYTFPDGIPGYTNGFPILDSSWTWNVRFTFATQGTYTGSWTLEDGVTHAVINPLVTGSAAVVVQPALPPTDIHLALGGPVENQQTNTPVEYTGTMTADPSLHTGETYFVKVTIAKSGGTHTLTAADLSAFDIYYQGSWQPLPPGSFVTDGIGNLVYYFPQPQSGFAIQDPEWTWNFRVTYADTGTYTATAQVIHDSDANNPSPQVFASDAISTTVVPQVIVPPTMNMVLLGPVGDVAVGAPAEYTGTLLANPADFTGRTFWVRVRLSKNGGANAMTTADLSKLELYQGGTWVDATAPIEGAMVTDGNDLVYYFPQPNSAFSIASTQWTWNFRFTYADVGVFSANADVIDSTDLPLLNAASLANASVATNVVAMPPDVALDLQGPVSGTQTGVPTAFTARLTNTAGAVPENAVVQFQIGRAGGTATTSDLALEYFDGSVYQPLPLAACSGDPSKLCGTFGPGSGFPIGAAYDATTALRATFATADTWTVQASVVGVPSATVYASDTLVTQVTVTSAQVTLNAASLHVVYDGNPHAATATTTPSGLSVAFTYDGSPTAPTNAGSYNVVATITQAGYAGSTSGTLVIDPAPITVTLSNLTQTYDGSAKTATVSMSPSAVPVSVTYDGSVVAPSAVGSYTVVAIVTDPNYTGSASGTLTINPIAVTVTLSNLAQTYDGTQKAATVATNPNGITTSVTYDGVANAPIAAGSYNVVATVTQAGYSGSASGTLVIAKAPATVTLSNLTQPFNGLPRPVTAMTLPASLPTSVTYDGSMVAPSAVGTYSVFAVVTDPNYSGSASGTLTIESNAVTVTLSNLAQTYDGTAKSATVSTSPNATTSVTYDGSPTAPTNAGSYNVVATVTQAGYSGSASGTLVIAKAAATVTLSNLTQTFDGTAKSATVMTTPASLPTSVTYDGGGAPSAIGSYTVVATVTDPNYTGSASGTLNIVAASAPDLSISITDDRNFVQYGKLLTYRIAVNNIGNVDVSGASVSVALPNTVLGANPGWTCVPLGTATCGSGGNGALSDTANIPANGGVVYLLNVWAKDDTSLTTDEIQMQASVTASGDIDTGNNTASDLTTMVIFRDGFEVGGNGAEPAATVDNIVTIGGVDANTTQFIDLSSAWASSGNIVRIASIAAGSQDSLVVQAVRIDGQLLVRLAGIADGKPLVGEWSEVPAGTNMLAIGLAAAKGESVLIVTGASEDLTASLSGAATSMTVFGAKP